MIRKIIKAIRRAKQAGYVRSLQKQLGRLEAKLKTAEGEEKFGLTSRIDRKQAAIRRAKEALAALSLVLFVAPMGCAHKQAPTEAIETAVVITEAALQVCQAKHSSGAWDGSQGARDARQACLQIDDIDRTRDATTALDDAVEAADEWIKTGAKQ